MAQSDDGTQPASAVDGRAVSLQTLDGQRMRLHCPICASERWMQTSAHPEAQGVQPVLTATSTNMGLLAMPVNQFICRNCGYSLYFMPVENVSLSIENG